MANRFKGEVDVKAGGDTFTLRFGVNAMVALEEELGVKTEDLQEHLQDNFSLGLLRTIFRIGLQQHHPDITDAATGDLLDEIGIESEQVEGQDHVLVIDEKSDNVYNHEVW